jgi:hypothetical protein
MTLLGAAARHCSILPALAPRRSTPLIAASSAAVTILAIAVSALTGCAARYDRPPKTKMIDMGFFMCPKCGSLSGGIFGKGPIRHYRSDAAVRCVHDWQSITKAEFQTQATARFGVDWSGETYFWFVESEKR